MPDITDAKILIIAAKGFEQSELEVPLNFLKDQGATVHIATPKGKAVKGWSGGGWGREVSADLALEEVNHTHYDALVLPGGQINPDILRTNASAVELVRKFHESGRIIAAICHATWLLAEAGILKGRDVTSYHSIRTDIENAGARWRDEEVVVDNGIITSRSPEDLDAFVAKIVEEVKEGRHARA